MGGRDDERTFHTYKIIAHTAAIGRRFERAESLDTGDNVHNGPRNGESTVLNMYCTFGAI